MSNTMNKVHYYQAIIFNRMRYIIKSFYEDCASLFIIGTTYFCLHKT
jgi:hypothetical protein